MENIYPCCCRKLCYYGLVAGCGRAAELLAAVAVVVAAVEAVAATDVSVARTLFFTFS